MCQITNQEKLSFTSTTRGGVPGPSAQDQRSTLTDSPRSRENIHFSTHNGAHKGNKQRSEYVQEERDTGRGVTKRRSRSRRRPYRAATLLPAIRYKQLATIGKLHSNYATTYATNYAKIYATYYAKNYGTICATFYATSYDTNYATTYATNYAKIYATYYAKNYTTHTHHKPTMLPPTLKTTLKTTVQSALHSMLPAMIPTMQPPTLPTLLPPTLFTTLPTMLLATLPNILPTTVQYTLESTLLTILPAALSNLNTYNIISIAFY
ncbi:hypothetical protein J6590_062390 [Homalodisca vitripennis]|nr:hypothetical protein J6590_062390 [Homalodisca vitripennis]